MFHKVLLVLKNAFFWKYARGTWQYDLMVAAILLFIFLTPRKIFHDEPLPLNVSDKVVQEFQSGTETVYRINAEVVTRYRLIGPDNPALMRVIAEELRKSLHRPVKVKHIEALFDDETRLEGFRVWVSE